MRQDVTVGLQQPPEPRTYPALQAPTTHQPLLEPRSMDENYLDLLIALLSCTIIRARQSLLPGLRVIKVEVTATDKCSATRSSRQPQPGPGDLPGTPLTLKPRFELERRFSPSLHQRISRELEKPACPFVSGS